jgi:hypothetical protein
LIEEFGPGSFLARLAKRLGRSSADYAFLFHANQFVHDIRALVPMGELRSGDLGVSLEIFGLEMSLSSRHDVHIGHWARQPI